MRVALAGGFLWPMNIVAPHAKKISVSTNGMIIQDISTMRSFAPEKLRFTTRPSR